MSLPVRSCVCTFAVYLYIAIYCFRVCVIVTCAENIKEMLWYQYVCVCVQDADASYDVNGKDKDPQPRYDPTNENRSLCQLFLHHVSLSLCLLLLHRASLSLHCVSVSLCLLLHCVSLLLHRMLLSLCLVLLHCVSLNSICCFVDWQIIASNQQFTLVYVTQIYFSRRPLWVIRAPATIAFLLLKQMPW